MTKINHGYESELNEGWDRIHPQKVTRITYLRKHFEADITCQLGPIQICHKDPFLPSSCQLLWLRLPATQVVLVLDLIKGIVLSLFQLCGSGSGRIRLHLGPCIRVHRYKMQEKAEFYRKFYFLRLFFLMRPNLSVLCSDQKINSCFLLLKAVLIYLGVLFI